ncbi:helix-turn-helix domain-containing protein [Pseudogracilibacillus sp. SO30301A]|uniref:helix-turn-helix domain-containing protein n=1 Tax=Pseudogracilibacillus sp. SO30301A TaxID=3098291 RepID=UPI00300DEB05
MSSMKKQFASLLIQDLQRAAIHSKKRHYFIFRALNKYISMTDALGVALIRYADHYENAYKTIYCGSEQTWMKKWLQNRVATSIELTVANLSKVPTIFSDANVKIMPYTNGVQIIWYLNNLDISDDDHKNILNHLEAISYVEEKEKQYFYGTDRAFEPELSKLITHKDKGGLIELLSLTKTISESDFVFWGDANSKQIEVTTHLGSQDSGFGFELPFGQGIGGNAAQNKQLLQVKDYKNCEYRYHHVSSTVDEEDVRTVLALPIKDNKLNTSGVLYTSNREVKPFPLNKKLLLLRLGSSIEPLTKQRELKQFFTKNYYQKYINQKKEELRNILQSAKQISELEIWLEELIKGVVIIVDQKGRKYADRVRKKSWTKKRALTFPLTYEQQQLGKLLVWTDLQLPLNGWSDLIDDVISAIYIILEREKRIHHVIEMERSQWISSLMNRSSTLSTQYKKGIRLQIPVDRGEVWAIYWEMNDGQITTEEKIQLEEVVLKWTKNPIIYLGNMGFIIFDKHWQCHPEELRNQLLKELPITTWIVHSAMYSSFSELQNILIQLQLLIERMTTFEQEKYVLEFNDFGLEYLLTNHKIADDLNKFATKTLRPIIEYDREHRTQFTKTLALSLVYQSPTNVAKEMYIHTNTVHYRVNRAKELLEMDLSRPGNDIALRLSAYTWLYSQQNSCE